MAIAARNLPRTASQPRASWKLRATQAVSPRPQRRLVVGQRRAVVARDRRPRSGCSRLVSRRDSGPSVPKRATPPIYRLRKQQGRARLAKRPVLSPGRPTGPRRSAGRPSPSNPQAALLGASGALGCGGVGGGVGRSSSLWFGGGVGGGVWARVWSADCRRRRRRRGVF